MTTRNDYDYAWAHGWQAYTNGLPPDYPWANPSSASYLGWHAGYRMAREAHPWNNGRTNNEQATYHPGANPRSITQGWG